MVRLLRLCSLFVVLAFANLAHAGDLTPLVGTWSGVVRGLQSVDKDWVQMTIAPDGTYEAVSYRQIGVFRSRGRITPDGEQLRYVSDKGQGSLQLVKNTDGSPVLKLSGTLPPIGNISVDLKPEGR